jgi:4-hydroxy-2,2'-bipyrrole-5-carbaldehyde O-methyltransferase
MKIRTLANILRSGQLLAGLKLLGMLKPFYRLTFLAAAKSTGLFELLSDKTIPFDQLAHHYCRDASAHDALRAWLQLGVKLKLLKESNAGFELDGLSKSFSRPENDAVLALAQETAGLHHSLIIGTLDKLQKGDLWGLADQDGELIARSSRSLEPFQTDAIDRTFPSSGAIRLLEAGCGSAFYIQYAAAKNPSLTALGIELQANVAEVATRHIKDWGLRDRVKIETGDIRQKQPDELFDIVTLYNNIYYFTVPERPAFLSHLRTFLKPGGFLLLTTCCPGGNLGIEVLNLWGASTAGCGRLPSVDEMKSQLHQAGFRNVDVLSVATGVSFYAFKAS